MYEEMRRRDEEEDAFYVYNKLAAARKGSGSRSQSESEDLDNNAFQMELKRELER